MPDIGEIGEPICRVLELSLGLARLYPPLGSPSFYVGSSVGAEGLVLRYEESAILTQCHHLAEASRYVVDEGLVGDHLVAELNLHHNLRKLIVYTLLIGGVACSSFRLHIGSCAYILGSSSGQSADEDETQCDDAPYDELILGDSFVVHNINSKIHCILPVLFFLQA